MSEVVEYSVTFPVRLRHLPALIWAAITHRRMTLTVRGAVVEPKP